MLPDELSGLVDLAVRPYDKGLAKWLAFGPHDKSLAKRLGVGPCDKAWANVKVSYTNQASCECKLAASMDIGESSDLQAKHERMKKEKKERKDGDQHLLVCSGHGA